MDIISFAKASQALASANAVAAIIPAYTTTDAGKLFAINTQGTATEWVQSPVSSLSNIYIPEQPSIQATGESYQHNEFENVDIGTAAPLNLIFISAADYAHRSELPAHTYFLFNTSEYVKMTNANILSNKITLYNGVTGTYRLVLPNGATDLELDQTWVVIKGKLYLVVPDTLQITYNP